MAKWEEWSQPDIDGIQSGDILETITKIPQHSPVFSGLKIPFIKHYGMVVNLDGKQCLIHNIIGRKPTIAPIEEVFKDRRIHRVLRTGMCDKEILTKYESCKHKPYRLFFFNCETLMTYIWGSSIGYPQQNGWMIGLTIIGILIIIILLMILFKKNK